MAKKKVFKGVINGQEFDNVQEYNARMNELVASGEDIEASSQTSIQDVEDTCENENDCCKGTNTDEEFVNMLPGFNPPSVLGSFLNELVTENPNLDEENLIKIHNYHKDNLPKIIEKISKMDYHAAKGYLNDIDHILMEITTTNDEVKKNDHDINERIASLQEKLDDVKRCYRVIEEYNDLYQELKCRVTSRINDLNTNKNKTSTPKPNILDGLVDIKPEKVDVNGILNLLSDIMGIDVKSLMDKRQRN